MKKLILLASLSLLSFATFSQSSKPEIIVEKFFKEYPKNPARAVEDMYATNSWMSRKKDAVDNMKNEVSKYTEDFLGKYYGYELINKKQCGESLIVYSYMVRYDRQPMNFMFTMYKADDKWALQGFKISYNLDDDLEQTAKLYYTDPTTNANKQN